MTIHVLVADDEPHIGRIIQTKLEQGPFRVTLVSDGPAALSALEEYPDIALVLLDVMMPGLTGLEVLARIRADARWSALPCMILTAGGHGQHREEAFKLNVDDFLTKPFSPKRLFARVAELTATAPGVS